MPSLPFYNVLMVTAKAVVRLVGALPVRRGRPLSKGRRWVKGQCGSARAVGLLAERLQHEPARPTVWLHAASMGEFQIARPLIAEMRRRQPGLRVVVTFFSPTGYEGIRPGREGIDHLLYLPLDTRGNARRFLDAVRPQAALFLVSEYWRNYLDELARRRIPVFLVSACAGPRTIFRRWYGSWWRSALKAYSHVFAVDGRSARLFREFGARAASCVGNPLWDNALATAAERWRDPLVERFTDGVPARRVCVAGSVHPGDDVSLLAALVQSVGHGWRFIVVPHETDPAAVARLRHDLGIPTALYSEGIKGLAKAHVLVVDKVGLLRHLYRYGGHAYVGGGFGPGIHSVAEPAAYGIPVAFGPRTGRQSIAAELLADGSGTLVNTADDLRHWLSRKGPVIGLARRKAAPRIVDAIFEHANL